jgi:hypothetical protein
MISQEVSASETLLVTQELIESFLGQIKEKARSEIWIKISDLPNSFYFDEAILLCQKSENSWIAWIPEHGQIVIHVV